MRKDNLQTEESTTESFNLKALEFAFEAVMTEYSAIRKAALSRDQYRGNVLNYFIVVLSGAVLALDFLIESKLFFAFLILSTLFSALGLVYMFHTRLNNYLLLYEHGVLRRQAEDLISKAGENAGIQFEYKVLQWQEYYRDLTIERHKLDGLFNLFSFGLLGLLPLLGSLGSLMVFFFTRTPIRLNVSEKILLGIASVFALALLLVAVHTALSGQPLWAEVNNVRKEITDRQK